MDFESFKMDDLRKVIRHFCPETQGTGNLAHIGTKGQIISYLQTKGVMPCEALEFLAGNAKAALATAYRQSPNAIGDFVRSQNSIANQQRILQNNYEQLCAAIGKQLSGAALDSITGLNGLLKAYNALAPETQSLVSTTTALAAALALLGKTGVITAANSAFSAIRTGTGILLGAKSAAVALAGALGPVGIALTALSAAYLAYSYIKNKKAAEDQAELERAEKAVRKIQDLSAARKQERDAAGEQLERLRELARYERMNNAEREEAQTLIEKLTQKYGDLGMAIDRVTGKLKIGTAYRIQDINRDEIIDLAEKEIIELRGAESGLLKKALDDAKPWYAPWVKGLNSEIDQTHRQLTNIWFDSQASPDEKLTSLRNIKNELEDNKETIPDGMEEVILNLQRQVELRKQLRDLESGRTEQETQHRETEAKKLSEETRRAQESLEKFKRETAFNHADEPEKLLLLQQREKELFQTVSGRFSTLDDLLDADTATLTAEQLRTVEQILRLREQEADIRTQIMETLEREQELTGDRSGRTESEIRALEALKKLREDIAFDNATTAGKLAILKETETGIFSPFSKQFSDIDAMLNADTAGLAERELHAVEKILRLREKESEIRNESSDMLAQEQHAYRALLERREKIDRSREIERELKAARDEGKTGTVTRIMQEELRNASETAEQLRSEYKRAMREAEISGMMTETERAYIEKTRAMLEQALSERDSWESRIDNVEQVRKSSEKSVVAWSAELLNAQLGATRRPQEDTARNTKRSTEILMDMKSIMERGTVLK